MYKPLATIAREELLSALSHGSNAREAVASLMARAKQDPELYRQLLRQACEHAIEQECRIHKAAGTPQNALPTRTIASL
jgi:hypothetical protein